MPDPLVDELPEHEKLRLAGVFARLGARLDHLTSDRVLAASVRRWWELDRSL